MQKCQDYSLLQCMQCPLAKAFVKLCHILLYLSSSHLCELLQRWPVCSGIHPRQQTEADGQGHWRAAKHVSPLHGLLTIVSEFLRPTLTYLLLSDCIVYTVVAMHAQIEQSLSQSGTHSPYFLAPHNYRGRQEVQGIANQTIFEHALELRCVLCVLLLSCYLTMLHVLYQSDNGHVRCMYVCVSLELPQLQYVTRNDVVRTAQYSLYIGAPFVK